MAQDRYQRRAARRAANAYSTWRETVEKMFDIACENLPNEADLQRYFERGLTPRQVLDRTIDDSL